LDCIVAGKRRTPMRSEKIDDWMSKVASGGATMSQRNLKWVEVNGGVAELIDAAQKRGIHLVRLTDDKGHELFAASQHPFQTLC
jgi:hypothetical protein